MRDRALFDLAVDSKLRGSDPVKLKIGELVGGLTCESGLYCSTRDCPTSAVRDQERRRTSLLAWLERRGGSVYDLAFPIRVDPNDHLSTRKYARLMDEWVTAIGLRKEEYGRNSLRRTKASLLY